jgi:hypothetical protein
MLLRLLRNVAGFMDRSQPPAIIMRDAFQQAAAFAGETRAGARSDGR